MAIGATPERRLTQFERQQLLRLELGEAWVNERYERAFEIMDAMHARGDRNIGYERAKGVAAYYEFMRNEEKRANAAAAAELDSAEISPPGNDGRPTDFRQNNGPDRPREALKVEQAKAETAVPVSEQLQQEPVAAQENDEPVTPQTDPDQAANQGEFEFEPEQQEELDFGQRQGPEQLQEEHTVAQENEQTAAVQSELEQPVSQQQGLEPESERPQEPYAAGQEEADEELATDQPVATDEADLETGQQEELETLAVEMELSDGQEPEPALSELGGQQLPAEEPVNERGMAGKVPSGGVGVESGAEPMVAEADIEPTVAAEGQGESEPQSFAEMFPDEGQEAGQGKAGESGEPQSFAEVFPEPSSPGPDAGPSL